MSKHFQMRATPAELLTIIKRLAPVFGFSPLYEREDYFRTILNVLVYSDLARSGGAAFNSLDASFRMVCAMVNDPEEIKAYIYGCEGLGIKTFDDFLWDTHAVEVAISIATLAQYDLNLIIQELTGLFGDTEEGKKRALAVVSVMREFVANRKIRENHGGDQLGYGVVS